MNKALNLPLTKVKDELKKQIKDLSGNNITHAYFAGEIAKALDIPYTCDTVIFYYNCSPCLLSARMR